MNLFYIGLTLRVITLVLFSFRKTALLGGTHKLLKMLRASLSRLGLRHSCRNLREREPVATNAALPARPRVTLGVQRGLRTPPAHPLESPTRGRVGLRKRPGTSPGRGACAVESTTDDLCHSSSFQDHAPAQEDSPHSPSRPSLTWLPHRLCHRRGPSAQGSLAKGTASLKTDGAGRPRAATLPTPFATPPRPGWREAEDVWARSSDSLSVQPRGIVSSPADLSHGTASEARRSRVFSTSL